MRKLLLIVFLIISGNYLPAQEIDKLRLVYEKDEVVARQVDFAVSADKSLIGFYFENGTFRILDFGLTRFTHHSDLGKFISSEIQSIDFLQNDRLLIICDDAKAFIVNWKDGKTIQSFQLEKRILRCDIHRGSGTFALSDEKGNLLIYDYMRETLVNRVSFKNAITAMDFHPKGTSLAVAYLGNKGSNLKGHIVLLDIATGQYREIDRMYPYFVGFNMDGSRLVAQGYPKVAGFMISAVTQTSRVRMWDTGSMTLMSDYVVSRGTGTDFLMSGVVKEDYVIGNSVKEAFIAIDLRSGERVLTTMTDRNTVSFSKFPMQRRQIYELSDRFLISNYHFTSQENVNILFDCKTMQIVAYLFVDGNRDFAIVAKDGRIYGNEFGLSKIAWGSRKSGRTIPLESNFENGFTPRILTDLVSDDYTTSEVDFMTESAIDQIPTLEIISIDQQSIAKQTQDSTVWYHSTRKKKVNVKIQVTENSKNADYIEVYQNSKRISSIAMTREADPSFSIDLTLTNAFGKENYIYFKTTSEEGIDSDKCKLIINYDGEVDSEPRLYIMTIGINEYKNASYNLNYAQADADAFQDVLKANASSIFTDIHILTIRNEDGIKRNIQEAFHRLENELREQDVFVFYFAGHGVISESEQVQKSQFYLIPYDLTSMFGDPEKLHQVGISAEEINQWSTNLNAQKQVYFLDACQSASALEGVQLRGAAEERAIAQLARSTGTFWIAASGSDQFAVEFEELDHGVFTYSLLEGLNGSADGSSRDGKITVRELISYIEDRVPELSQKYRGQSQYPTSFSYGNDFPLALIN